MLLVLQRNWTAVHFAARSARAEVVKTLIISGAKVNACDMVSHM